MRNDAVSHYDCMIDLAEILTNPIGTPGARCGSLGGSDKLSVKTLIDVSESAFKIHYLLNPQTSRVDLTVRFFAALHLGLCFLRLNI